MTIFTKCLKIISLLVIVCFLYSCARPYTCSSCRDDDITSTVLDRLNADRCLAYQNIHVSTYEGVVTLEGAVHNPTQRRNAVRLAESVPNVKCVKAKLRIKNKYNI